MAAGRWAPAGFLELAREYAARYGLPVMLAETNIRGTPQDRLTWLKFMEEQCERLAEETDFRGFCWYPSIEITDWCHLCKQATGAVDPQGIWWLDASRWGRYASELSDAYAALAAGRIDSSGIRPYRFEPEAAQQAGGHLKLMSHWPGWLEQGEAEKAA